MPLLNALTSDELIALRGDPDGDPAIAPSYEAQILLSICPNTVVYSGRVNMTPDAVPMVDIAYDTASGTLADARTGMAVLFSHNSDPADAYFRGYLRKPPTSGVVYVGANGDSAPMSDNDYFWVLNDFAIHEKLPRANAGVPVPDWDTDFRTLWPVIDNLPSAVAGFADDLTDVLEVSFAPDVTDGDFSGGGTFSYLWEYPTGAAITVGSDTSKDVTFEFDAGFDDWIHFTATDSNNVDHVFHIKVWSHDAANPPQLLAYDDLEITCEVPIGVNEGSSSGHNGSVRAFDGAAAILDQTLVCAWVRQRYNGTEQNIGLSGNLLLVGRFRNERSQTQYQDAQQNKDLSYDIEGPLAQLAARRFPAIEIDRSNSPNDWNEVESLTYWRAIWLILTEYSTFASLHSLSFDDMSEDRQLPVGYATQGGDLLNSIADLCQAVNAVFQDSPAGMTNIGRRASLVDLGDRDGLLVTVADFGRADRGTFSYEHDHFRGVGHLTGSGGGLNTTSGESSAYDVQAPGFPASGVGEAQLHRQVLIADQTTADERLELETRAGNGLAAAQNTDTLIGTLPDGYHFLTPAAGLRYSWAIDSDEMVSEKTFDATTFWWLQSKRIAPDPKLGRIETQCVFVRETSGTPGQIIDWPLPEIPDFGLGPLPPVLPMPFAPVSGHDVDLADGTGDGIFSGGTWHDDCIDGKSQINLVFLLGDIKHIKTVTVEYSASATIVSPANSISLRVAGDFEHIVDMWSTEAGVNQSHTTPDLGGAAATEIRVHLYGDDDACDESIELLGVSYTTLDEGVFRHVFDFTADDGGWTGSAESLPTPPYPTYTPGVGWQSHNIGVAGSGANQIIRLFDFRYITGITVMYRADTANEGTFPRRVVVSGTSSSSVPMGAFAGLHVFSFSPGMDANSILVACDIGDNGAHDYYSEIIEVIVEGRGSDPFL